MPRDAVRGADIDAVRDISLDLLSLIASCRKECARGAVTSGDRWVFFAYQAPKGNDYAKYARTDVLDIGKDGEDLDLILGILIDWVWFTLFMLYAVCQD